MNSGSIATLSDPDILRTGPASAWITWLQFIELYRFSTVPKSTISNLKGASSDETIYQYRVSYLGNSKRRD